MVVVEMSEGLGFQHEAHVSVLTRWSSSPLTRLGVSVLPMTTMGQRCKARRLELGISEVAELARRTAIGQHKAMTRSALSQLENGITMELKYGHTVRLAKALGVNTEWLVYGTGPKIESKIKDPAWAGMETPAQKRLIETIRLFGSFLKEEQCDAVISVIKGMLGTAAQSDEQAAA